MNPKTGIDTTGAPSIILAGRGWVIPPLAMRQNRVIVPRVSNVLLPLLQRVNQLEPGAAEELNSEGVIGEVVIVLHAALTRAYDITLDEFLDLPISPGEWARALGVVIQQTQFFQSLDGGGPAAAKGEKETTES